VAYFLVSLGLEMDGLQPSFCSLYQLGAKYTPDIVLRFQFQRLFLPIFLHANFVHLLMNVFFQMRIGFWVEKYFGTLKMIVIYLVSGVGGNLLSAFLDRQNLSIGASTSVFGIFGAYGCYFAYNWNNMGPGRNLNLLLYLFFVVVNFSFSLSVKSIDMGGHLGGYMVGGAVGFMLLPWEETTKTWAWIRIGSAVGSFLFFGGLVLGLSLITFPCGECIHPCVGYFS